MSRAERRAAARRSKAIDTERSLSGWKLAIMAIVTFAMVFSSLGYILIYGGPAAAAACVAVCLGVAGLFWLFLRRREGLS